MSSSGSGRLAALGAAAVLGLQPEGEVARDEREDGVPFRGDLAAEDRGHRALAVEVDHQHPVAVEGGRHGEVRRGRGLADAALEVGDGGDLGRQALRAVGAVFLGAAAFGGEMRAQPQHLVEGEPLGAAVGLAPALGEGGVGAQHPAEMRRRHRDQVPGDLPGGEAPQRAAARPPRGRGGSGPRGPGRRRGRSRRSRRSRPGAPARLSASSGEMLK